MCVFTFDSIVKLCCNLKSKAANEHPLYQGCSQAVFLFLAGAEGLEPSARGFGAKSTLSVKPRVKIQSPHKIRIKTALSVFESAVTFCLYSFC